MTATIVYDKSIFDVNSISDKGRYGFTVREDSAAQSDDDPSTDENEDEGEDEGEKEEVLP